MKAVKVFVFLFVFAEVGWSGTWLAHYARVTEDNTMCQVTGTVYSSLRTNFGAVCSTVEGNTSFSGDHKCSQNQTIIFVKDLVAIAKGYAYPGTTPENARLHGFSTGDATPRSIEHDDWHLISCRECYGDNFKTRVTIPDCIDTTCPVVIDTEHDGFEFGGEERRVAFAMWPYEGFQVQNWVVPRGDDAFLALDLNGNGAIDDGTELFGNGTLLYLENRLAENGFIAMAQYDRFALGGNEDGRLSPEDEVWPDLLMWLDRDADGVTDRGELTPVIDSDLIEISLITYETNHWDRNQNWWRFPGIAKSQTPEGKTRPIRILDIFFKRYPDDEF